MEERELIIPSGDVIAILPETQLPGDFAEGDFREAIQKAKQHVGVEGGQVSLFVMDRVLHEGRRIAARSYNLQGRHAVIEVSTEGANLLASPNYMTLPPNFKPGSWSQQLWALTFEEVLHQTRRWVGQFDESYERLGGVRTDGDIRRYFLQPEKQAVANALNNRVLKEKFGSGIIYFDGRVVEISVSKTDKPEIGTSVRKSHQATTFSLLTRK